jgi:hypothetical protein
LICVDIEFLIALFSIVNFNMYRFILIALICVIGFFYLYYQLSICFILIALFSYQSVFCCINSGSKFILFYSSSKFILFMYDLLNVNCYICSLFNNKFKWKHGCRVNLLYQNWFEQCS